MMKLAGPLAAAGLMLLAAQGTLAAPASADLSASVSPESVGFDSARLQRLDDYMASVVSSGKVAGMTTLLSRHGKVVEFRTYGKASLASGAPMARDEIFRIYSMSKPITGVAMMILFEEGKWKLDDPVTKFVPEFKDLKVLAQDPSGNVVLEPMRRAPTMREIMSHTAGFGYGLSDNNPVDRMFRDKHILGSQGLKQMIDRVATIPLKFQPGTDWSYSVGVDVQGYIVEKISGESLGQFLDEHIFKPLKMKDTAFYTGPERASRLAALYIGDPKTGGIVEATSLFGETAPDYTKPPLMESGGGGLLSTTTDFARFCQMLLNGGELDGVRILSPATVQLMGTNVIPKDVLVKSNGTAGEGFNEAVGFGLDFMVVKDPRAAGSLEGKDTMSWGGAAGTWFWIDPTNDIVFVGMIQRMGGTGEDLGGEARTLTYQALTRPEK
ncbi:MAG TPA: serine hydrolase domain-containing protein [Caulobacteraceae bacterium]|jgi:CubicO group peptidase (beta-lactamase class C family)|nr:serine hydrolase domain-containing protein [Caulobacteraceae bacterium]